MKKCIHQSYEPENCVRCKKNEQIVVKCRICEKVIVRRSTEGVGRYLLRIACSPEHSKVWQKLNGKGWFHK